MPSSFRTYEAQSRLLVAVLASNPELRLNFKAIAKHYGSDTTASGIEHRFRPLKKHAMAVRQVVAQSKDPKDLAGVIGDGGGEKEVAKYYGESTPLGIEFQFRSIKKEAKSVRERVTKGEAPWGSKSGGAGASAVNTPATTPQSGTKRKTPATTAPKTMGSTAKRAKKTPPAKKEAIPVDSTTDSTEDDEGSGEVDYERLDLTPTRAPKVKSELASRPPPLPQPQFYPAPGQAPAQAPVETQQQAPEQQHRQVDSVEQHDSFVSIFGNGSRPMSTPGLSLEATPSEDGFGFSPMNATTPTSAAMPHHMPSFVPSLSRLETDSFSQGPDLWGSSKNTSFDQDFYPQYHGDDGTASHSFDDGAA